MGTVSRFGGNPDPLGLTPLTENERKYTESSHKRAMKVRLHRMPQVRIDPGWIGGGIPDLEMDCGRLHCCYSVVSCQ